MAACDDELQPLLAAHNITSHACCADTNAAIVGGLLGAACGLEKLNPYHVDKVQSLLASLLSCSSHERVREAGCRSTSVTPTVTTAGAGLTFWSQATETTLRLWTRCSRWRRQQLICWCAKAWCPTTARMSCKSDSQQHEREWRRCDDEDKDASDYAVQPCSVASVSSSAR